MPYYMVYEVVVVSALLLITWLRILWLRANGAPLWLYWTTCFYAKLAWAFFSLPYLLFAVPVLGESLHRAKTTAYDQAGQLVPVLSASLMKQRIAIEEEERAAEMAAGLDPDDANGAALRIQKITRGKRIRAKLMRHIVVQTPVGFFVSASEIENWFK